jgi:PAS domain S-box-containing protein
MGPLKKFFAAPVFDDEEKTHQAYLLHVIISVLIITPILYAIYVLIVMPEESSRALAFIAVEEIVSIIPFIILRYGYVFSAAVIEIASIWLFFLLISVTSSGVYGLSYLLGNGLVITIAGILLGGRGAWSMTFLAVVEGGLMVYAGQHGWVPPDVLDEALPTWIVAVVLFSVGTIMQNLSAGTVRDALKRARASEERYRLISRVNSDYTFATEVHEDGSASLSWVAGAFEKMTGYAYEEYVASGSWLGHMHPDDIEKDARDMEMLHKNQEVRSEIRTFAKNGEIRWERIFAHPVWDEKENRLVGIVGAVQDVTEQKHAEEIARETLLQQSAILNNIPDVAWLKDKEGRYIAVNEQFYRISNLKGDQIIGKTDFDLSSENLAKSFREGDILVMESKQRKIFEEQQTDSTGRTLWAETVKTPIFNAAGEVVGTIGISRDITERKQAEIIEQNRRTMLEKVIRLGKLVTQTNDLRSTIRNIWHGVHDDLEFDRLAIFLYNPERNSMDDTVGTDNQGQMVDEWDVWYSLSEVLTFTRVLEKPNGIYFTHNYDIENNIKEGNEMYGVKDYVAVAAWAGDKPVAVICADNSITQRPITDEQLEALRLFGGYAALAIENARLNEAIQKELAQRQMFIEELESKNAELERFTYTASHDLKSPLVTIVGFLRYLEKDAQGGDFTKFRRDLERIEQAANKMQQLLKDLLELSRVGRLMNPAVAIPLKTIVEEALELVHGQIEAKNVLIEFHDDHLVLKCDQIRIVEVYQNLFDNAIKFMGDQLKPCIEIGTVNNEKNEIVFYVKDNGIGIASDYHENIFGLFNKLRSDSEGTGIGLALVKRIIEVHGGRIWVESQINKGTTFYFTLPVSNS